MSDLIQILGGIYQIQNTANGKRYVGSAVNLAQRERNHWSSLRRGDHGNRHLQNAWNKYGEDKFEFKVVGRCAPERLIELEQEVIDHLKPEYNMCLVAGSKLGTKHTEETRVKIGNGNSGKKRTPEQRANMSRAGKGRRWSPAQRINSMGRIVSSKTRAKLSIASAGRTLSSEWRAKISASNKGRKASPETRAKISAAGNGRRHSLKTRAKMSTSHKREFNKGPHVLWHVNRGIINPNCMFCGPTAHKEK